ncbi:hypothetical protein IAT38_007077 [Cryptococcus sp. DSM 104549]
MPSRHAPSRPIRTEVEPLLVGASSTHPFRHEVALASKSLWNRLVRSKGAEPHREQEEGGAVSVAVEWPEERRLGKGKARSLVVWVKRLEGKDNDGQPVLHIHPSLLPPIAPSPLSVLLHVQPPVELSLVILQSVVEHDEEEDGDTSPLSRDDLDFSELYAPTSSPQPIIREGSILSLPHRSPHPPSSNPRVRLLLLEPVAQGHLTPHTRIIVSDTPFHASPNHHPGAVGEGYTESGGDEASESSYAKTHMSLADFDPDTFLSSSLTLSLNHGALPDGEGEWLDDAEAATSLSSSTTSGSLTPRPGGARTPPSPPAPVEEVLQDGMEEEEDRGVRFSPVRARGKGADGGEGDVCWLGVGGLGRAGIFEGDWVMVKSLGAGGGPGRLVKALAWERLDEPEDDLPTNPILLPPALYRSLIPSPSPGIQLSVQPTPFGARPPTVPIARTITLARLATAEAVDKRYERSWLKGQEKVLRRMQEEGGEGELVRRGDVLPVPAWVDRPLTDAERQNGLEGSDDSSDDEELSSSAFGNQHPAPKPTAVVYFLVTSLSYDPLIPLEEDFRSSLTSKARAGELGCWVGGETKMVWLGLEKGRVESREGDLGWHGISPAPPPFAVTAAAKLRDLLSSTFYQTSLAYAVQLSILVKGSRGSGKRSLLKSVPDEIGFNVVDVECYDIVGDTPAVTAGSLLARLEKAQACAPSILVLHHIEALAKKTDSSVLGKQPPIVKVLEEVLAGAKKASAEGWPVVVVGTTVDGDGVPVEVAGCFKQEVELKAPNESERLQMVKYALRDLAVAPDVDLKGVARQTAALNAGDIASLIHRAHDQSLKRVTSLTPVISCTTPSIRELQLAGVSITAADLTHALGGARAAYSDSIGAPKIPNVKWDDVGGLVSVKQDILDTIQLPLDHPEMFGEGLKKRSGILLYGPPGTGKTLLAKAVATSCSLNFFSVKGPELLNMYIGESEANVRRIFQRARDAAPCVIFMDELDSIAPKRGNQGDSGGVMDRIVSQLLAELDGMSSAGGGGGGVFVMGATNRPDLLDPALLRPGRFDKMLYLSIPTTHSAQASILSALTRKFALAPELDLEEIAEQCPFNYTGADLYALCADAMLGAMTRQAGRVDEAVARLNAQTKEGGGKGKEWVGELTPQYYLAKMAKKEEMEVRVGKEDFEEALKRLVPSVSQEELGHYERVQKEFQGFAIGKEQSAGHQEPEEVGVGRKGKGKGKGKARAVEADVDGDIDGEYLH